MSRPRASAVCNGAPRVRFAVSTPAGWIIKCRRTTSADSGEPTLRIGARLKSSNRNRMSRIAKAIRPIDNCSHRSAANVDSKMVMRLSCGLASLDGLGVAPIHRMETRQFTERKHVNSPNASMARPIDGGKEWCNRAYSFINNIL